MSRLADFSEANYEDAAAVRAFALCSRRGPMPSTSMLTFIVKQIQGFPPNSRSRWRAAEL
jgi:hypothetical protein